LMAVRNATKSLSIFVLACYTFCIILILSLEKICTHLFSRLYLIFSYKK
jgi:hypothetical protein